MSRYKTQDHNSLLFCEHEHLGIGFFFLQPRYPATVCCKGLSMDNP